MWYYNFCSWLQAPNYCSPIIITSTSAGTINGNAAFVISINLGQSIDCSSISSSDTVYESNDSVYYYLSSCNCYKMLYNWNALAGDTQTIYLNSVFNTLDSVVLRIDSVNMITINGFNKKAYFSSNISPFPQNTFEGFIIEDIGNTSYLFPRYGFCDPLTQSLRCYEDTIIGLYQYWTTANSCDTIIYLGIEELHNKNIISVSPNPTTDFVTIQYKTNSSKEMIVSLFNLYGQLLKTPLTPKGGPHNEISEMKVDIRDLDAGIYFVKMNVGEKEEVRKVVKW